MFRVSGTTPTTLLVITTVVLMSFWSCLFGCRRTPSPTASPRQTAGVLQRLGIFYGWPSAFDGATSAEQAATKLGRYQVVVLGGGLEQPGHGDHQPTRRIMAQLLRGGVEVHGYIPLGSSTALSQGQIMQRVKAWKAMGATGIFFDEAGHDYGNTRQRQNQAFKAVHRQGMKVFANAWNPRDLFDTSKSPPHNPTGAVTELTAGDCYLYESFGLSEGQPETEQARQEKMARLEPARQLGIRIFGVTTAPSAGFFDAAAWQRVVEEARRLGLEGLGWGEYQFGAQDNRMPDRPFPPAR